MGIWIKNINTVAIGGQPQYTIPVFMNRLHLEGKLRKLDKTVVFRVVPEQAVPGGYKHFICPGSVERYDEISLEIIFRGAGVVMPDDPAGTDIHHIEAMLVSAYP